ncbi:MAG: mitochondrial fission ELM1 family protein, partial [Bacteroidota bacterium]|nr:ELM1/GtrOC1 family putative glycosyltransferase [Kiloniellaceae bacterium]
MTEPRAIEAQQPRQAAAGAAPRVWLLLDDRPGHATQVVGLADALGWPYETKELRFTALNRLSNRLLGASRLSLNLARSAPLAAPWPDLVIAMGRRAAPIARWVKRQSGGRTRLVQLGRKAANVAADFDLAVTCSHFQLPPHPRRVDLLLPPTQVTPGRLRAAAARWPDLFGHTARPRVCLLVGGTTAHHRLTPETAECMAAEVQRFAEGLGGSLTCVTSRRSGAAVEDALKRGAPAASLHCWRRDQADNPYLGYLALADILVVTGESESMLAEAADAGKPLAIYPIPAKPAGWRARVAGHVLAAARGRGALAEFGEGLIQRGLVVPPRDLELMHR